MGSTEAEVLSAGGILGSGSAATAGRTCVALEDVALGIPRSLVVASVI